jgi:hypothetical protein
LDNFSILLLVPPGLNESLLNGQQTLVEINGALYLKLDPTKVEAQWLKKARAAYDKSRSSEQLVDSS